MTTRLLPRSEWPRLAGTEVDPVWTRLPEHAEVLVIEDDGRIVGTLVLVSLLHAECLWIAPAYRQRPSVMRRLLSGMWDTARARGARSLWSGSLSETTTRILQRLGGQEIPGRSFAFPVKEA